MQILETLMERWQDQRVGVLQPRAEVDVRDSFARVGSNASADVVALYQRIGGMEIPDSADWRLWSPEEVITANTSPSSYGPQFADYLIACWTFRTKRISPEVSEVFIDYGDGKRPIVVASSLEAFLEALAADPLRVTDPQAHRAQTRPAVVRLTRAVLGIWSKL